MLSDSSHKPRKHLNDCPGCLDGTLSDSSHKPRKRLKLPQMSLNTFLAASPHVLESAPLFPSFHLSLSLPLPRPLPPRNDDVATRPNNMTTTLT